MKRSAFVAGVAVLYAVPAVVRAESAAEALLTDLIAVLNARDAAATRAFVEKRCSPDVAADVRAQRFAALAERGKFTLVRFEPADAPNVVQAVVKDGAGALTSWRLEHDGATPPRLTRLGILAGDDGPPAPPLAWNSLRELVDKVRAADGSPALIATVVRAGARETAVDGKRALDGAAAENGDPWQIGSIGKPLCSTIIGKLIESGTLRWDTQLSDVLPNVVKHAGYANVTLEQIMHHRGGIPADPGFKRADVDRIVAGAQTPTAVRMNYVRDILARAPIAAPGQRFAYSNAGYAILGTIAEQLAGVPYETLLHRHVFTPLGLKRSYAGGDELPAARPTGHARTPDGYRPINQGGPLAVMFAPAGGGIWMSAEDLAAFGAAHLAGLHGADGLLRAATIARLHEGVPEADGARRYACGWGIEPVAGAETMHGHNGSNGTFRAELGIFPKANVVVAALANAGADDAVPSAPRRLLVEAARRYAPAR